MTKRSETITILQSAFHQLEDVLQQPKTIYMRDSTIKRFELVFDLAWKAVKVHLQHMGIPCASPKACFQEAYRQGLIDYEKFWLDLIEMRNETVHTYDEKLAEEIYARLPEVVDPLRVLIRKLNA